MRLSRGATALAVVAGLVSAIAGPAAAPAESPPTLQVGLTGSLIQELPGVPSGLAALAVPADMLNRLAQQQTGVPTRVTLTADHDHLARLLTEGKVDFALFQGVEFAWARRKYPDLRPLALVVNDRPDLRACLLVRRDSGITDFAGLRARACALAQGSRQHCQLFLEGCCRECGAAPRDYFSRLVTPTSINRAIEAVVKGEVDATVVDDVACDCFRDEKPGRFARLQVLRQSEVFPAAVIAYADGALDRPTLRRARDVLLRADRSPRTRAFLTLCRMTGFEAVPDDYDRTLEEISVAYQPPVKTGPLDWLLAGASRFVPGFEKATAEQVKRPTPQGEVRQAGATAPAAGPGRRPGEAAGASSFTREPLSRSEPRR